jgi:hypothetical protein
MEGPQQLEALLLLEEQEVRSQMQVEQKEVMEVHQETV